MTDYFTLPLDLKSFLKKCSIPVEAGSLHSGYAYLQELFTNEFFLEPDQTIAYQVRKATKAFIDEAISDVYFNQADAIFSQLGFQKKESYERSEKLLKHIRAYLMYLSER